MMGTKVSSMLFDLEMEEPGCDEAYGEMNVSAVSACRCALLSTLTPAARQVAAVVEAVLMVPAGRQQQAAWAAADQCSVLAQALVAAGYNTCLRQTVGGGAGGQCLRNLHHSFLCCIPERPNNNSPNGSNRPDDSVACVIVDPSFREQFQIAHPTARYAAVLAALPAVLICQADRIQPLVELLCSEMSLAFHSAGIVLPPWRYAKSMLSKWLPRQGSVDLTYCLPGPAAGAATSAVRRAAAGAGPTLARPAAGGSQGSNCLAGSAAVDNNQRGSGGSGITCLSNNHNGGGSSTSSSASGSHEGRLSSDMKLLGGGSVVTSCAIAVPPPSGGGSSQLMAARMAPGKSPLQRVVGFPIAAPFAGQ